ncbi:MAG TPA: class I SAM-dependent methyltransferase [Candidatus Nitrosopolaris sp.]|nr:class I SAM-dependent methyltransferase [Candidatus Nitrosopolaris sp.]
MAETVKPEEVASYTRMAGEIYDLIYSSKDYESQAAKVAELIKQRCKSGGDRVLEAACGTGSYMKHLRNQFSIDGFDLSAEQVATAKKKLPENHIVQADMLNFDMGQTYDAVLCLFSSIGYLKTKGNLDKAVANMARHLKPGGVVIIEPWLKPEDYIEGNISMESASSNGKLSVDRMGYSRREGNISVVDLHHMVGTERGVQHFLEVHELAMYTEDEFRDAFTEAGLTFEVDPEGLIGRGLYIGNKP